MCVALCDFRVEMDLTVDFDDEFTLCTIEVWEVAQHNGLSANLVTAKSSVANTRP